ncbi:MAG: hypothetical protein CM1200mP26_11750 [Acidimicrobiales bacterium]|nr:MAG: hypothetical protein CM1200mP26_11750 [Acidimicrobiales bacterium]
MAVGNKHLATRRLKRHRREITRFQARLLLWFSGSRGGRFDGASERDGRDIGMCVRCEAPASGEVCAFCRLLERVGAPMLTITGARGTGSPTQVVLGPPGLERSTV